MIDQHNRTAREEISSPHAVAQDPIKNGIDGEKRRGGDQATQQRHVATHHCILDSVGHDQDQNEIDCVALAEASATSKPQQENDGHIDDRRPNDDFPPGRAEREHESFLF